MKNKKEEAKYDKTRRVCLYARVITSERDFVISTAHLKYI